jgi:integrase
MIYKKGSKFHIDFTYKGDRYQRSARTTNRRDAEQQEKTWYADVVRGEYKIPPKKVKKTERTRVSNLLDALQNDYQVRGKASVDNLSLFRIVGKEFGDRFADTIDNDDITKYIGKLRNKGRANSTINNHLQILEQAFKLAKLPCPEIPHQSVKGNARKGFLLRPQFDQLYAALPNDLKDFALCAYLTGWRTGAVKQLLFSDIQDGELHQRPEISKNGIGYTIPLFGELAELIARRKAAQAYTVNGVTHLSRYIFHRGSGQPVNEYRKSWKSAVSRAGLDGLEEMPIPHDMRRSACRNLVRSGVPRSIAKKFTGHETDAIFERYNITDAEDMRWAATKLEQFHTAQRKKIVAIG